MAALASQSPIPALELPPGFSLVSLREVGDAFGHACAIAEDKGAGTFVWVRRFDVLEFAVVLEPEETLSEARRAALAGMVALADAVSSFAPPGKPITFAWPMTLLFDGGRLGGGRLGWPSACAENEVPNWLVFGAQILAEPVGGQVPGLHPDVTWLAEEGFLPQEHLAIVESFARYLMAAFDQWREDGFAALAARYLTRLPADADAGSREIGAGGDLLAKGASGVVRAPLALNLERPDWFDPLTGLPRL